MRASMDMKHLPMTRRKDPPLPPARPHGRTSDGGAADSRPADAFDVWLQRGLHQLFDGVAREPIPDELLRLIEDDRRDGAPSEPSGKRDERGGDIGR